MVTNIFDISQMQELLCDIYAPWVQELKIIPIAPIQEGFDFLLPKNSKIVRDGDVICGQAIASVADSVGVLSLSHMQGRFRSMTTVDLNLHFLHPLFLGNVQVRVKNLKNGKRLATVLVEFRGEYQEKISVSGICTYAYLDDEVRG